MDLIIAFLLICLGVVTYVYYRTDKYTVVQAAVSQYSPGNQTRIKMDIGLPKEYKKGYIILARALEIGPVLMDVEVQPRYWYPHDYLVINTDYLKFRKGHFYLLEQNDKYKIAMCTASAYGLPPIFVGSDNLVESCCVGEVIGTIDAAKHTRDYRNMAIPCATI